MTITAAHELARSALAAWETGAAYTSITTTPWATIAADLDAAADALTGQVVAGVVARLRDRAEDARARAQRQVSRRALVLVVEVVL